MGSRCAARTYRLLFPMKVVQFMRKPGGRHSIERVFEDIKPSLSEDIDVSVYVNPYHSRGFWRRAISMLRAALHQGDINHITGDVHFLNIFMRKRSTILTIHDCVTLERLTGIRYRILWLFWYWLPAKRSALITVISGSTKKELERHLGSGNWPIKVLPDPVSPEFIFSPKASECDCPRILQIGTTTNKNVGRVAAALKGVPCKLVIIGKLESSQLAALESNSVEYENHVGISREAVVDEYQKCDIVMFASLYEGFGLPILEAQAVGRPVITSSLYSMPEVGGKGAYYVNPYDTLSIRRAVSELVESSDLRNELIKEGLANVSKYQASIIAGRYSELYREVYEKRFE